MSCASQIEKNNNSQGPASAFDSQQWDRFRANGGGDSHTYAKLGWVGAHNLHEAIRIMLNLPTNATVIDFGAGSLSLSRELSDFVGQIHAFDISHAMLGLADDPANPLPENITRTVASAYEVPFPDNFVDAVVSRMVFHHLENVEGALLELFRIIKLGGQGLVVEYVAVDEDVKRFEREIFDIKEAGRHLWTGNELLELVIAYLPEELLAYAQVKYAILPQYSVMDWMRKSGLPQEKQQEIFDVYVGLADSDPDNICSKMNITFVQNEQDVIVDVLVDRTFAHIQFVKKELDD